VQEWEAPESANNRVLFTDDGRMLTLGIGKGSRR
jgi:hypothetical protein